MKRILAQLVRSAVSSSGFEIRRRRKNDSAPPPLFEDPLEALCYQQGGKRAAFKLPLEATRYLAGFSFSLTEGWHPFVATLRERAAGLADSYERSLLRRYHESWQPKNAREAMAGFSDAPQAFEDLRSYDFYLTPWTSRSVSDSRTWVKDWYARDYAQYGKRDFDIDRHGIGRFGPASRELGILEYHRLAQTYDSIDRKGYDINYGYVYVDMVVRGGDVLFLSGGGHHRKAAAAALGMAVVPAVFRRTAAIDVDDVDRWPNVRSGLWSRDEALRFVDHLFEFDSKEWARSQGLLAERARKQDSQGVIDGANSDAWPDTPKPRPAG